MSTVQEPGRPSGLETVAGIVIGLIVLAVMVGMVWVIP